MEGQQGSPEAAVSTTATWASPGILQRLRRLLLAEFLIPSNFTSEHCVCIAWYPCLRMELSPLPS